MDYLDGIRGGAALWVVMTHVWYFFMGHQINLRPKGLFTNLLLHAHLAVDVFIVLSGFCLMLPVAHRESLRGGAMSFFKRRARRILPTFYAALVVCFGFQFLASYVNHQPLNVSRRLLLCNVFLLQDVSHAAAEQINIAWWSVALEWKIYFLFPFFVWLFLKRGAKVGLLVSAVLGFTLTIAFRQAEPGVSVDEVAHACFYYTLLFALGMAGAHTVFSESNTTKSIHLRSWRTIVLPSAILLGILLVEYPISSYSSDLLSLHYFLVDPVAGAMIASCLVLLGDAHQRCQKSFALSVFNCKALVITGRFGYSLYLTHYTLAWLISGISIHSFPQMLGHPVIMWIVTVSVCWIFGYLFYLCFERPFTKASKAKMSLSQVEGCTILSSAP